MTTPGVVLTVGNSMMGDDGAGPLLAELMTHQPVPGWIAIDGGAAPENVVHQVHALNPKRVIVFDATDMELAPGEIRVIDPAIIADMFITSTHTLPLTFLIEQLQEGIEEVILLGVQPDLVAFYYPVTESVVQAVNLIHQRLEDWGADGGFERLE